MDCCNGSIIDLGCIFSCDTIATSQNAASTGVYTLEVQPDGIQLVSNTVTAGNHIVFDSGYLNEDGVTVFKIVQPDGTYLSVSGADCFQVSIKPSTSATVSNQDCPPAGENATYKNSDNSFSQTIPCGTTYTADDITVTEVDSSTTTYPANIDITCDASLCPKTVELYFAFESGNDTSVLATNGGTTWTLTAISDDGGSGTITVDDNGGGFAAFVNPTTIANGETIQVKRTTTSSAGWVLITGAYA